MKRLGGVYTIPKGISPKVNVIARLEFELTFFEAAAHLLPYAIYNNFKKDLFNLKIGSYRSEWNNDSVLYSIKSSRSHSSPLDTC